MKKIVPAKDDLIAMAVIDPSKKFGDEGQYVKRSGTLPDMQQWAEEAKSAGMEVRWYYQDQKTADQEPIMSQIIVTHIPPGHVQPFHTHKTLHEVTLVMSGVIVAIDHDTYTEETPRADLEAAGSPVAAMQVVVEGPNARHTVANFGDEPAVMVTVQTARVGLDEFPHDWHRDGK